MLFDYLPEIDETTNRSSSFVLSDGTDKTTVGNPILTLKATGNGGVTYAVGAGAETKIADLGGTSTELKVYVKADFTTKKADVLIYDIKGETPKCIANVSQADITATCLKRAAVTMLSSLAPIALDNVKINTTDEVKAVTVTAPAATDGTLTSSAAKFAREGETITITPTPAAGKKLTAVKVNGNPIENEEGYTYEVKAEDETITITAEFARADVTEVTVAGTAIVKKGTTGNYTATVKAGEYTFTEDDNVEVTWSLVTSDGDVAATVQAGTNITGESLTAALKADDNETDQKVRVKASVVEDVTKTDAQTYKNGYCNVDLVTEDVYTVTSVVEPEQGGKVELKVGGSVASQVKASQELVIEATPNDGYTTKKVSYRLASAEDIPGSYTEVHDESGYKVQGSALSGDIVVKVEFEATPYTVTNGYSAADGNSIAFKVDGEESATATIGQTVTVQITSGAAKKIKALTYTPASEGAVDILATREFKMPAKTVTINAEFEDYSESFWSENFSTQTKGTWDKVTPGNSTYTDGDGGNLTTVMESLHLTNNQAGDACFKLEDSDSDGTTTINNALMLGNTNNKAVTHTITLPTMVVDGGKVKITYKTRMAMGNNKTGNNTFKAKDGTVVFGLEAQKGGDDGIKTIIGDKYGDKITLATGKNNTPDFRSHAFYATTNWLSVEAIFDFAATENNVTLKVTDLTDNNKVLVDNVKGTTSAKNIATFNAAFGNGYCGTTVADFKIEKAPAE